MGVPAGVAVRGGEHPHVRVGDRSGDPASPATVAVAVRLIHLSARFGAGAGRVTSQPSGCVTCADVPGVVHLRSGWGGSPGGTSGPP